MSSAPGTDEEPTSEMAAKAARLVMATAGSAPNPVDLIDEVFGLAEECGGMAQLRRLVERLAGR